MHFWTRVYLILVRRKDVTAKVLSPLYNRISILVHLNPSHRYSIFIFLFCIILLKTFKGLKGYVSSFLHSCFRK